MLSSPWFHTLFSSDSTLSFVQRVWDVFLNEGFTVIFRVSLAFLLQYERTEFFFLPIYYSVNSSFGRPILFWPKTCNILVRSRSLYFFLFFVLHTWFSDWCFFPAMILESNLQDAIESIKVAPARVSSPDLLLTYAFEIPLHRIMCKIYTSEVLFLFLPMHMCPLFCFFFCTWSLLFLPRGFVLF